MSFALVYWILMLIWLVFGFWAGRAPGAPVSYRAWGGNVLLFILLIILGWKAFGPPVHS